MKRKIFGLSAVIIILTAVSVLIVPKWLELEMSKRLDLVEVVTAAHDLPPRTQINEEDIVLIRVPSAYLNHSVYLHKEEVLGKLTVRNGFIPEGSFFYFSALEDFSEVSDAAIFDLHDNQVLVALETNVVALGANALSAGQAVDVYVTIRDSIKESKIGSILKNVRILGVKDHKGLNLDNPESTHTPYVIQLAISDEALPLIQKAQQAGEITYYVTRDSYEAKDECQIDWDSEMIELLEFQKEKAIEG